MRIRKPVPVFDEVEKKLPVSEENVLAVLAEDYRVNPALHMTIGDLQWYLDGTEEEIASASESLEASGDVMILRDKKSGKVKLVKATYAGLKKAYPKEHYRWFPEWITEDRKF